MHLVRRNPGERPVLDVDRTGGQRVEPERTRRRLREPISSSAPAGSRSGGAAAGARCPRARAAPRAGRCARSSRSRCRARCRARVIASTRREAVAEVRPRSSGRGRRVAPASASRSSSWSSACVAWTTVVCGPRQPASVEQLDRPPPVLGEALLDLARLLVGVDVEHEALALARSAELPRASRRGQARTECGATPTRTPAVAKLLDPTQVGRRPTAARKRSSPPRRVGDGQQHELDPGRARRLDRGERLGAADVVELADRRVPGGAASRGTSCRSRSRHAVGRERFGLGEHRLAPRPEVVALDAAAQRALERVAVRVDEPGQRQRRVMRPSPRSITECTIGPARW